MKRFTCFVVSLALVVLLAAGCRVPLGAGPFASIPMSNAPIYQQDGITAVAPTLEGTIYLIPLDFMLNGQTITNYPVAGTVSGGKITVTLPDIAEDQLRDMGTDSITVTPAGTKVFAGLMLMLVDAGGVNRGGILYGTSTPNGTANPDITAAGFLYSEAGPVSIAGNLYNMTLDIASAKSGWNLVTLAQVDTEALSYSNNSPLPGESRWFFGGEQ